MSNPGYRFKFNGLEHKERRSFASDAPDYRIVAPGLNFKAICENSFCRAFGQSITVQKGFGKFNVAR